MNNFFLILKSKNSLQNKTNLFNSCEIIKIFALKKIFIHKIEILFFYLYFFYPG